MTKYNKEMFLNEVDSETAEMLEENDAIVGKMLSEGQQIKSQMLYDKIMELSAKARQENTDQVFDDAGGNVEELSLEDLRETEEDEDMEMDSEFSDDDSEEFEAAEVEAEVPSPAAMVAAPVVDSATTMEVTGATVKSIREAQGANQCNFAKELGVSQGLISQVEKGTTPVSKKLKKVLIEKGFVKAA